MKDTLSICSYREYLISYLYKKFSKARKEDIEDAVQNTLIKAIRFQDKWHRDCSLKTWLSVIAVNMYVDSFRKRYNKYESLINSSEELYLFEKVSIDDFSETLCDSEHQNDFIKELFSDFKDNIHIQAFCSNVIDDIDYKDIAIQQNIPIGTVKSRIFRAKKLLQEKYREIIHKYEDSTV